MIKKILRYLKSTDNDKPFIIWGESGAGASSIIAASSNSVIH
jgi:hypothetical protein